MSRQVFLQIKNVASNVATYINLKEAGHFVYGWSYVAAQVILYHWLIILIRCENYVALCFPRTMEQKKSDGYAYG